MKWNHPIRVRGRVSPVLLRNLELYMSICNLLWPHDCKAVPISAAEELEQPLSTSLGEAVMCFSGGLDSAFTAWRHHKKLVGRRTQDITAGVFVHGFSDIMLEQADSFEIARIANERMLQSLGMRLIPVTTNFYRLPAIPWSNSHGVAAIAAMLMLSRRFGTAILANSHPYNALGTPWPTSPITDPLLSSQNVRVLDDGGEVQRHQKVIAIAEWPEAMQHLRVCLHGRVRHENCCECEKCIRTILAFRLAGAERPACFKKDVTDAQIRRMRIRDKARETLMRQILQAAEEQDLHNESWVRALRHSARKNAVRREWRKIRKRSFPRRKRRA
jgi:hypothetical protein